MVNRNVAVLLSILMFASLSVSAAPSVGDISDTQQSTIMLKSALERAKLEKELSEMRDVKVSASEVCTAKGIGMLALKAVYGVNKKRYASFYYNPSSTFEAQVGDTLLCGEKILSINMDKVMVEKKGVTYTVTGISHAITKEAK